MRTFKSSRHSSSAQKKSELVHLSISILASLPVPLKALQIIFLNLMSDECPAVAISKEDWALTFVRDTIGDYSPPHWGHTYL